MTPKLFVTIAIKGAVLGGAICNLVFTLYFEHWLKREREKAERFAPLTLQGVWLVRQFPLMLFQYFSAECFQSQCLL